jgi:4-hydroxy-tetrahydrodipicolinate synthase
LLEAARIPVLLYQIPSYSGIPITADLLKALSRYEILYGIKDSTGDLKGLVAFIKEFPKLKIFTGSPSLIQAVIENGGAGVISGTGNVLPGETAAVFRDARAGKDIAPALARLNQSSKILGGDMASMKFMLGQLGLRESCCRPPFLLEPNAETKEALKQRVAKYRASIVTS